MGRKPDPTKGNRWGAESHLGGWKQHDSEKRGDRQIWKTEWPGAQYPSNQTGLTAGRETEVDYGTSSWMAPTRGSLNRDASSSLDHM